MLFIPYIHATGSFYLHGHRNLFIIHNKAAWKYYLPVFVKYLKYVVSGDFKPGVLVRYGKRVAWIDLKRVKRVVIRLDALAVKTVYVVVYR